MAIKLIVGLGNPGKEYAETRHNVGAWFVEKLAAHEKVLLKLEKKFHGMVGKIQFENSEILLVVPTTYMNLSGNCVAMLAKFYKIPPEEILVVHDDLDLSLGTIKLKQSGGHGGHNGLKDIVQKLGTNNFLRLRIGIAHPGDKEKVVSHVLGRATKKEKLELNNSIDHAMNYLKEILNGEIEKAMQELHSK